MKYLLLIIVIFIANSSYSDEPVVKRGFSSNCEKDHSFDVGLYDNVDGHETRKEEIGLPSIEGKESECIVDGKLFKVAFNYDYSRNHGFDGWDVPHVSFNLYRQQAIHFENMVLLPRNGCN